MYLISGQPHLRLQPAVTLVAVHAELRLYTVQGVVDLVILVMTIGADRKPARLQKLRLRDYKLLVNVRRH